MRRERELPYVRHTSDQTPFSSPIVLCILFTHDHCWLIAYCLELKKSGSRKYNITAGYIVYDLTTLRNCLPCFRKVSDAYFKCSLIMSLIGQ